MSTSHLSRGVQLISSEDHLILAPNANVEELLRVDPEEELLAVAT